MGALRGLGIVFVCIGILLATLATVDAAVTVAFLTRAEPVSGEVVDIEVTQSQIPFTDPESGRRYYAVIAYHDATGDSHTMRSPTAERRSAISVGQARELLYRPDRPETARVVGLMGIWGRGIVLAGTGLILLAAGGAVIIRRL